MKTFPAYATNFELHSATSNPTDQLKPLVEQLQRLDFTLSVKSATTNQGQMVSDFDDRLAARFQSLGCQPAPPTFSASLQRLRIRQELDFAFSYQDLTVSVEVEKANREKILRDMLKAHQYLHAGADLALLVLPRNYPHSGGIWNLFDFGRQCYDQCHQFGFGTPHLLSRILLLGYTQHCGTTQQALSTATRQRMRKEAIDHFRKPQ